jgi:hypothetical protein
MKTLQPIITKETNLINIVTKGRLSTELVKADLEQNTIAYYRLDPTQDPEKVCKFSCFPDVSGKIIWVVNLPNNLFKAPKNRMVFNHLSSAVAAANAFLFTRPVSVGDTWTDWINQGDRDCEVIAVKKLRFRIRFEMPTVTQEGWRRGTLVCGVLYYEVGETD